MAEPVISPRTRVAWRRWLERNHLKHDSVLVLMHKRHTGKPAVNHRESLEEALCFGWIDTIAKRVDDNVYARRFVKRKLTANWSVNTLSYAKRLRAEGKMYPAGIAAYERGLLKLPHDHDRPKTLRTPADLRVALAAKGLTKRFAAWPPSTRKMYLYMLFRAKRQETRAKRIREVVQRVLDDKKSW